MDTLILRFEALGTRAVTEGHYNMSIQGWAYMLLKECPLSPAQAATLLEPFGHTMPRDEDQFRLMLGRLRRLGHQGERRRAEA